MKYNLSQYGQTISNTSVGDISFTTDELINITTTTNAQVPVPASGTTSGTLVLDCDLGSRIYTDEVRYYFDSATPRSTVASGINFYYKNESFDTYISLDTYYNGTYYYTVISGTTAPRYIRVAHVVTATTSGFVNGLQVLNDDTQVDFGQDGTATDTNFNLSIENALVQINDLYVYNSGPVKSNAKLIIEPQGTAADDILSISDSIDGPWYGVYREEDMVTGPGLWDTGSFNQTEISSDILKLISSSTDGTYTTRIVNIDDYQRLTFNIMSFNYPTSISGKSIIATDDIDTFENIEVRSSNSKPLDKETYIEMIGNYGTSSTSHKYTRHRWIGDSTIAETSDDWNTDDYGYNGNYFEFWFDSITEDEYIVDKPFRLPGYPYVTSIYLKIRRKNGAISSTILTNDYYDRDCWWNTYKLVFDAAGGFWIYYYLHRSSSGIDGGNYYLRYYDGGMNLIYNRQATSAQGTFLYDMDSVYESDGDMWYTDRNLSTVFKVDRSGDILASYLATEDIRGLFALNDGGCWFIQQQALIRLDSAAQKVDEITLSSSLVSYIYSDLHDGFWLQDGWIIRHLAPDGTEHFNIEVPNLYWITVMDSGVVTKQHDGSTTNKPTASYISRYYQRIIRTWDYPRTEGGYRGTFDYNRYGVRSHTYDDLVNDHAAGFPIAIDTQWNTYSEWTKVSLRDYNFTNEQYHQIRFTLRADNSSNSPEVYGLWTQRAIEIPNIYPGNYGRFYLKSDVTYINDQDVGDYTSKVRAYWLLAAE